MHLARLTTTLPLLVYSLGLISTPAVDAQTILQSLTPTIVTVGSTPKLTGVKRLGINLGGQSFWDSQQLSRNLVFRNPGFEAETWQSILHCKSVSAATCTDDDAYGAWPANFFAGAQAEFMTGSAVGQTATITKSTVVNPGLTGIAVTFASLAHPIATGDYLVVRMSIPGNAQAGWWPSTSGGAAFSTDTTDLSPNTPGKQALRIDASGANQSANISSYFDSTNIRSFVQLNGAYTLSFRAKAIAGNNQLALSLRRVPATGNATQFLSQTISLSNTWQDYAIPFTAADSGGPGTVALSFAISGASIFLDDVSLAPSTHTAANPTAFRDEVVSALGAIHPGILRYMDSGANWGSSLDNMLAPAFARTRAGYSNWSTEADDIPLGLDDFLVLCQTLGAEPWYTMQAGMTKQEMANLMDYLGGSTSTPYGARRAALGHATPWTTVFPKIHLEFGNEVWNTSNPGATMTDPVAYAQRATAIFAAARASSSYSASRFDLIADGWAAVPWWTQQVLNNGSNFDTVDAAPYLFNSFNDASSNEAIFGPMFAQPELFDSVSGGQMMLQAQTVASAPHPTKLSVYETNLSTNSGSVLQSSLDSTVPSLGAGIASTEHMLLMLRDLGITDQTMFSLGGFQNGFYNTATGASASTPLWGGVVDMGNTNRMRPTLLAEQLANSAILPTLLTTSQSGGNPTWNQPASKNDSIALNNAHFIQSFAFTDGSVTNVVLFNLSRTQALPVTLLGSNAPFGLATLQTLTSANITDSNENTQNVGVTTAPTLLIPGLPIFLPPYSMTVVSSGLSSVASVSISCPQTSLAAGASMTCFSNVTGTGSFNSGVTWSASAGTITAAGLYTAPATAPASGIVTIKAASTQDIAKSASTVVAITTAPAIKSVTVSCLPSTAAIGSTVTCKASVAETGAFSSAVTWSASTGTITSAGVYIVPATAPSSVTITAVSTQDTTKSASAKLTITNPPVVKSVTVTCAPSTVYAGATTACSATLTGTGSYSTAVTWTTSAGTIDATGHLTAPADGISSIKVTATSVQTSTVSGSATVKVNLTPAISAVKVTQLTATSATVTWTVTVPTYNGIDYGTTLSYGLSTPWVGSMTTTPAFTLINLTPSTTYYLNLDSGNAESIAKTQIIIKTAPSTSK